MRTVFAVAILVGSTIGAMAADGYGNYRSYFDEKPAAGDRTKLKSTKTKRHPIEDVDTRRYDDGVATTNPDNLKLGYRNRAAPWLSVAVLHRRRTFLRRAVLSGCLA